MTSTPEEDGRSRPPEVLISGTFDVGNYGDLLFPLVAEARLARLGYRIVPVAPTGGTTVFADACPAISLSDALARDTGTAGMLIGGGDIIHPWRASFLNEYRDRDLDAVAYPLLWFGASVLAALKDAPIAWNAPGAPGVLPFEARRRLLEPALAAADHVAVRDAASARALPAEHAGTAAVIPDTAADVVRLWGADLLGQTFAHFRQRKSLAGEEELLAVQVRPGGWGKHTPASLATQIKRFAADRRLVPLLLSTGPSLGDRETLLELSRCLECRHVLADDCTALGEIAAVIGRSRAYVGNSLHGYITAMAYGVSGAIVARPGFAKFSGFAEQIRRPADVVRDWGAGLDRLASALAAGETPRLVPDLHQRLDWHWQRIAEVIARPAAGRPKRAALLAQLGRTRLLHDAFGRLGEAFDARLRRRAEHRDTADAS